MRKAQPQSPTPELMADAPAFVPEMGCRIGEPNECPMIKICHRRLELRPASWVMCEIPDRLDLEIAEVAGMPYVVWEASGWD